jgi:microcystin-dependent protein
MSRNSSGTYSLPEPPFVPNTSISSSAVNSDFSDVADALTDSLSRTGLGGMQTTLGLATGGFNYSADPDTGISRSGANTQVITVGGVNYTITASDITAPDGSSILPLIGEIRMWALPTAPTGWVFMRGQACTSSYPLQRAALIAASNPYGTSGGDPRFPNMQCRLPAGFDADGLGLLTGATTLGNSLGEQSRTLLTANLPAYTPSGTVSINDARTWSLNGAAGNVQNPGAPTSGVTGVNVAGSQVVTPSGSITGSFSGSPQGGTSTAFSIVQPTIVLNFIGRAA